LMDLQRRSLSYGDHTLRMIGLRPKRCSSSHQSSTFAVGNLSLSLKTLMGSFF
jgi:hypothetical protein